MTHRSTPLILTSCRIHLWSLNGKHLKMGFPGKGAAFFVKLSVSGSMKKNSGGVFPFLFLGGRYLNLATILLQFMDFLLEGDWKRRHVGWKEVPTKKTLSLKRATRPTLWYWGSDLEPGMISHFGSSEEAGTSDSLYGFSTPLPAVMIHFILLVVVVGIPVTRLCGVLLSDLDLGYSYSTFDVIFGPFETEDYWFSSILLSLPEALVVVFSYILVRAYLRHLVNPWLRPLERLRNVADGLAQGTSHAWQSVLTAVSATSSSVHRLETTLAAMQARLLSLSCRVSMTTPQPVVQTFDESMWTAATSGFSPLYEEFVAAELCATHGLDPFPHSITTFVEFMQSPRARTWSLVLNFQDPKGQQVSKSAARSRQTSCSIDADVFAVSETSATSATQKKETFRLTVSLLDLKQFGVKPCHHHGFLKMEGIPSGVLPQVFAVFLVLQSVKVEVLSLHIGKLHADYLWHSFICKNVCIRFIVAHGVPGGTPDQALKNNSLWRAIHSIIVEHDMPTIVAGDFNSPPQSCEAWSDLWKMGFSELFQLHFDLFGEWLPPTCKGVTRNDAMIVSHHLSPTYRCSEVIHDAPFRTHSPLIASFDLKKSSFHRRVFCMPEALHDDILSSDLFQHEQERLIDVCRNEVHQCLSGEPTKDDNSDALANVGKTFEKAYCNTQRFLEKFCPLNATPPIRHKQKGRFRERKFLEKPPRQCPPKGRNGSYEPPCEVFKTRTMQWVRQLRRLESLARALKKSPNCTLPLNVSRQFGCEWYAIQHAPGFRPNFGTWCQKHALVPIWYHDIPPFDWISSLIEVFRPAVDAVCHAEDKAQSRVDKYAMSLDFIHFGSAMAYRKLKPPKPTSIDHLMVPHEFEGKRMRVQEKSKPVVSIAHPDVLTPSLPLQIGENCISIVDVADDLVYLDELPPHVGSQFHATQYLPEFDPEALHRVFFDFWEPFWLRDSGPRLLMDRVVHLILMVVDWLHLRLF